jgi:hypothetical protein
MMQTIEFLYFSLDMMFCTILTLWFRLFFNKPKQISKQKEKTTLDRLFNGRQDPRRRLSGQLGVGGGGSFAKNNKVSIIADGYFLGGAVGKKS